MREDAPRLSETALDLRRAFDAAFGEAPPTQGAASEDLLALRVAGDPYAVRLGEIAGLFKDRRVTPLPSPLPELVGVAGIRGRMVPVYDLRALLEYPLAGSSPWLMLAPAPEPLGFAFDAFEGQLRAAREQVVAARPEASRRHVSRAVRIGDLFRDLLDVASLVEVVRGRVGPGGLPKER